MIPESIDASEKNERLVNSKTRGGSVRGDHNAWRFWTLRPIRLMFGQINTDPTGRKRASIEQPPLAESRASWLNHRQNGAAGVGGICSCWRNSSPFFGRHSIIKPTRRC